MMMMTFIVLTETKHEPVILCAVMLCAVILCAVMLCAVILCAVMTVSSDYCM
jgi:hypothetical protein